MVVTLVGLVCVGLGVCLCWRSPDPPGMEQPSTFGQRVIVAGLAGIPLGATVAVAVLFVYACVSGQPVA